MIWMTLLAFCTYKHIRNKFLSVYLVREFTSFWVNRIIENIIYFRPLCDIYLEGKIFLRYVNNNINKRIWFTSLILKNCKYLQLHVTYILCNIYIRAVRVRIFVFGSRNPNQNLFVYITFCYVFVYVTI